LVRMTWEKRDEKGSRATKMTMIGRARCLDNVLYYTEWKTKLYLDLDWYIHK